MFLLQKYVTLFEFHLQVDMLMAFENMILRARILKSERRQDHAIFIQSQDQLQAWHISESKMLPATPSGGKGTERSAENTALGQNQKRGRH